MTEANTGILWQSKPNGAPRICGLYLIHIQSYSEPTFVPLSLDKTVIRGRNDAGKSVIEKSLKLFGGVFGEDDYACLVHYSYTSGQIFLYLSNRTVLTADITVEIADKGTEKERRKGKAQFCLYNWQMTAVLKKWDKYSSEIPEYLGWISLPDEKFCVNFVDGKRNILINTNEKVNTALTDVVCKNIDLETRLTNIKRAEKTLTETRKSVTAQRKMLQDMISDFDLPAVQLANLKSQLMGQLFMCNLGVWMSELTADKLIHTQKTAQLRAVQNMKTLLCIVPVVAGIETTGQLQFRHSHNRWLQAQIRQLFIVKSISSLIANISHLNTLKSVQSTHRLKHLEIRVVCHLTTLIQNIFEARNISDGLNHLTGLKSDITVIADNKARLNTGLQFVSALHDCVTICITQNALLSKQNRIIMHIQTIKSIWITNLIARYIEQVRIRAYTDLQYMNFLLVKTIFAAVENYNALLKLHGDIQTVRTRLLEIPTCPTCGQTVSMNHDECHQ